MNRALVVVAAMFLVPLLLLPVTALTWSEEGCERPPGSEEIAAVRIVLLPFAFQVRLIRFHSEIGSAFKLDCALAIRDSSIPESDDWIESAAGATLMFEVSP